MEYLSFLEEGNTRTAPCLAIYGANASGKSNIIKAFASLKEIVQNKFIPKAFYFPNKLHPNNGTTLYEIGFLKDKALFSYTLEFNKREIIHEKLLRGTKCVFSIKNKVLEFKELATEVYSLRKLETIYSVESLNNEKEFHSPFLTVLGKNYAGLNSAVTNAFNFLSNTLKVYPSSIPSFDCGLNNLIQITKEKNEKEVLDNLVALFQKLDIDITKIEYKRNRVEGFNESYDITFEDEFYFNKEKTPDNEIYFYHKNLH